MASETVLITGVAGFVGRHLAAHLKQSGATRIYGTILPQDDTPMDGVELMKCRIEDRADVEAAVRSASPSVVYHLAAQSSVPQSLSDPEGTFRTNVMGTVNLLEALRGSKDLRSIVLVGSAEVYGIVPESALPVAETADFMPNNPYACSKACVDTLGAQSFLAFGVPVVRVRPFNHIGPGQSDAFATSSFARQIAEIEAGIRPPELMVGNLDARRDFTDVRDIVRAYVLAAEKCTPGEAYNICSGRAVGISEVLERMLTMTSAGIKVVQDPERMRPSDLPVLLGDCSKFKAATGWEPEISLDQTLKDLLDYWRIDVRR